MGQKQERRKQKRIPIAVKIFAGYLVVIILMLLSNFYLLTRMSDLREIGDRIGKSLEFVAKHQEIIYRVEDLRRIIYGWFRLD